MPKFSSPLPLEIFCAKLWSIPRSIDWSIGFCSKDLCFALITALTMAVVAMFYAVHFARLYDHFWPKLNNGSSSLAELTDMTEWICCKMPQKFLQFSKICFSTVFRPYNRIPPIYEPYDYSHTYYDKHHYRPNAYRITPTTTTPTTTTVRPYSQHEIDVMKSRRCKLLFNLYLWAPTNFVSLNFQNNLWARQSSCIYVRLYTIIPSWILGHWY